MLFEAVAHALDDLLTHPLILYLTSLLFPSVKSHNKHTKKKKGKKWLND